MHRAVSFAHRIAKREDLPQIVDIYNSTIPSRLVTADTEPVSVESRVRWFDEHSADFRPLWVVEVYGHIGGWLSFSSFYGRPAYSKTAEISVYVNQAHRKQGLGSYPRLVPAHRSLGSRAIPQTRYAAGVHLRPQPAQPGVIREIRFSALGGVTKGCGA